LKRYQTLLTQNAIPQQQLDTQVAMVAQLEATLKTHQAAIDNANLQLTYSQVTAPFAGRIGLRLVDPGNIVHASDQNGLLVIAQIHPIAVLFTVPEDNLPPVLKKLRDGVRLTVEAWNRDNSVKLGAGYLLTVDNQIDATTGTSKLKAIFDNESGVLFPNQFVNIRLLVDTQRDQLVVPSVAIQHGQQGSFVYVVGPNSRVQLRIVATGIALDNTTQIVSGLEEGEQVVVDGTDRLQNNSEVRIRPGGAGGGSGGRGGRGGSGRGGRGRSNQEADAAMAAPAAGDDGITAGADGTRRGGRGGRGGSGRGRGRRGGGTPE
jgi:multidrug efflux system membrane fusion protein